MSAGNPGARLRARLSGNLGAGEPGVVLIDGRSGSGKTTFAAQLAEESGAQILHLEDLYPGWDGLAAGSRAVADVLRAGEYRGYDWLAGDFGDGWVALDPARPLVIEGCGAVTARNLRAVRDFIASAGSTVARTPAPVRSLWLECPAPLRRQRALARDGEIFAPHWDSWAAQEETQIAAERPIALVDEIVHT
ncbi:hypothetical protein LEUCIP111803_00331 [Leucobacter soli]|uniref:Uncharacterized protein n=1 Tax=Leucobacter soli TaxID=2812850 RepID=A0A916JTE7_9MICO|nr:hypothetical protein [Leucobacter soli]CAG7599826.1 hypothetical protein LEUCIP111803_00331 [Leucobacter soli]